MSETETRPQARDCDREAMRIVAAGLGDTPETTISVHLLRRGACRAIVSGRPANPRAVVVQSDELPEEPTAFGEEPRAIWAALATLPGWRCVNVGPGVARAVATLMQREMDGVQARTLDDIYHTLEHPAPPIHHPAVRRLTPDDLPMLESAPAALHGAGFSDPAALLAEGIVAGAVVHGTLVAIAHTAAITPRHADIGVATHEDHRGRGLASAAAALVAREAQATGRTPVWSCGATNAASLRVAAKLGFREVSRRVYLIPDGLIRNSADDLGNASYRHPEATPRNPSSCVGQLRRARSARQRNWRTDEPSGHTLSVQANSV